MHGNRLNLKGRRFGDLVVLKEDQAPRSTYHTRWLCQCGCGLKYAARGAQLVSGRTTRCIVCARVAAVETRRKKQCARA